jgi:hypothetical protein
VPPNRAWSGRLSFCIERCIQLIFINHGDQIQKRGKKLWHLPPEPYKGTKTKFLGPGQASQPDLTPRKRLKRACKAAGSNELRVCAARSRRRSPIGRTRWVWGICRALWRFHPGRSVPRRIVAARLWCPEGHDRRVAVEDGRFRMAGGVVRVNADLKNRVSDSKSPWRDGTRGNRIKREWLRVPQIMAPWPGAG